MKTFLKYGILCVAVSAVIIVPFACFGDRMERWTDEFVQSAGVSPVVAGLVLAGLLAGDILLPVPSSIVSTACGFTLGPLWGTIASLAGMAASCAAGYWIGRKAGTPAVRLLMNPSEVESLRRMNANLGWWFVAVCRPVPVLAEASVFFVGMTGFPFARFMLLSSLSNLVISTVYASAGALSLTAGKAGFLAAFAASIAAPGIAMLIARRAGYLK